MSLGVPLLDEYLEFLAGRCRPNTVLAVGYDLKVFFTVVGKSPKRVKAADVLAFMTAQRTGRSPAAEIVQPVDGQRSGVSTRTLRRRLSSVSGLYAFLHARGDVTTNPVPRGLPTRRERQRPGQGVPLVRGTRTLPRILTPAEVDALTGALRSHRDRAMVAAMVLGGLRRCEVIGLGLSDLRVAERRVFIAEGKGGHQRLVPISTRFFQHVTAYLETERPADAETDRLFVVLKRPRRGHRLTAAGLDEVLNGARGRAGLTHATCLLAAFAVRPRLRGEHDEGVRHVVFAVLVVVPAGAQGLVGCRRPAGHVRAVAASRRGACSRRWYQGFVRAGGAATGQDQCGPGRGAGVLEARGRCRSRSGSGRCRRCMRSVTIAGCLRSCAVSAPVCAMWRGRAIGCRFRSITRYGPATMTRSRCSAPAGRPETGSSWCCSGGPSCGEAAGLRRPDMHMALTRPT
ncbi:MAG TPA: tyrosine-type recombinase/integrase [Kribbella sp.]